MVIRKKDTKPFWRRFTGRFDRFTGRRVIKSDARPCLLNEKSLNLASLYPPSLKQPGFSSESLN